MLVGTPDPLVVCRPTSILSCSNSIVAQLLYSMKCFVARQIRLPNQLGYDKQTMQENETDQNPENKPYVVAGNPGDSVIRIVGREDKYSQRGILHTRWKVNNEDHAFENFDNAARHAYMQGWVYSREVDTGDVEGAFEIQVQSDLKTGNWVAAIFRSGKPAGGHISLSSLEEAKLAQLKNAYFGKQPPTDLELRRIARLDWDEKRIGG
jgi:hypothetical protein